MRVAHGGFAIGMAQKALHFVKRPALIDQKTRETMAQIMHAHIWNIGFLADGIPGCGDGFARLIRAGFVEDPIHPFRARQALQ